ncbi:MAG: alpha/beta hydrolase, partial [Phototrophicaceae bacterium]
LNITLFIRLRPPFSFIFLWLPQLVQHALSPFWVVIGVSAAVLGLLVNAPIAAAAGALGAAIAAVYIWGALRQRADFASAFGADWQGKIPADHQAHMLQRRWSIGLPPTNTPRLEQDIPFWTIPGSERQLLCDVWQPSEQTVRSGMAIVYLHASGWYLFDKDFCTRPFFRQLTAQGHVVMDVAYRLCPEVDIYDMVGDVKRALAWVKTHAADYQVNPEQVVLMGASAGGHLALMAAYTPQHPQFTPPDVGSSDLSVRAVVSYYGPSDLCAVYQHTHQERVLGLPKVQIGLPGAATMKKTMQDAGRLDILLGGHLHEVPAVYELASPVTHVHSGCPPTLLISADLDVVTPTSAMRALHRKLLDCGVTAIHIVFPLTQHGFDLLLPQVSPPAQAALYEVERFLMLVR